MPSPPCALSEPPSTCVNISKMLSSLSRGMPVPVSCTATTTSLPSRCALTVMLPPRIRVLARVVEQVTEHLSEPSGIGLQPDRLGRQLHPELVAERLGERAGRFDRLLNRGRELDAARPQLEAVVRDAVQVEQIVDQPNHLPELPLHRVARATDGAVVVRALPDLEHVRERSERTAQLVCERREELVLAPVRLG